jgi:hypothetical protein
LAIVADAVNIRNVIIQKPFSLILMVIGVHRIRLGRATASVTLFKLRGQKVLNYDGDCT